MSRTSDDTAKPILPRLAAAAVAATAEIDPRTLAAYLSGTQEQRPTTRRAIESALRQHGHANLVRASAAA